jgi:regulatory protein
MKAARPPLSLKARALQWLAQREHSRVELRRKLMRAARLRDADHSEARDAGPEVETLLDWLVAERHLSEARFVESRLHARSARFGNRRIAQELGQHGVSIEPDAAERLKASEFERARNVWLRRYGEAPAADDAAERARQMRFLAARGFSAEVIRRVVRGQDDGD